jgi:hypothetical protein
MKAYGGVDVQVHIFLTSALAGGEWLVLPPGERGPVPIGQEAGRASQPVWTT